MKLHNQGQTSVTNLLQVIHLCITLCFHIVIKAERVSNDSVDKGYVFPDEDDNLTNYNGGSAQLMLPSGLLQDISMYTHA